MIIGLLNQKGGSGKTTIALSIAHHLGLEGKKVLLIDSDDQQSSVTWYEARKKSEFIEPPFQIKGYLKKDLDKELDYIKKDYDYIVIDGPGNLDDMTVNCVMASNIIIVPLTPGGFDLWASMNIARLIKKLEPSLPLRGAFLINRYEKNSIIGKDALEALSEINFPRFNTVITKRTIHTQATSTGKTIFDVAPLSEGALEIQKLVQEINQPA